MIQRSYQHAPWQRPLSRRRVVNGIAAGSAGLAAMALIGCAREKRAAPSAPAAQEPKRGGVLVHGAVLNYPLEGVGGYDPHTLVSFFSMSLGLIYQTLVGHDSRTFELVPEIAQRWEQPSESEYLFTLPAAAKWHDRPPVNGRSLVAADVVYSLERARTPEPRFLHRALLSAVDKIEAVDTTTVKLTTKGPHAPMLNKLAADALKVLAPEVIEKLEGRLTTPEHVIGTGAFLLHTAQVNVGSEVVRNPTYWKAGLPYLDAIRLPRFAEDTVAYAAFLGGRTHVTVVPGPEVKNYIAQQGKDYTPYWAAGLAIWGQPVPNTRIKPFSDPRVWKALRLLIDHEELRTTHTEVVNGRGQYGSIFPSALDAWDLTHEEYKGALEWKQPKDEAVRAALELLRAAGFDRTTPLKFEMVVVMEDKSLAELLQAQWRRFSQGIVDLTLEPVELPVSIRRRAQRQFEVVLQTVNAGVAEPDAYLSGYYHSTGGQNYSSWVDPTLDEMIDKQARIFETAHRKALVREIIGYMIDHSPFTTSNKPYRLTAVKPTVRDHPLTDGGAIIGRHYERVWLDA